MRVVVTLISAIVFLVAAPAVAKVPCAVNVDPFSKLGKPTMKYKGAQFGHIWNCRAWLNHDSLKAVCVPTRQKAPRSTLDATQEVSAAVALTDLHRLAADRSPGLVSTSSV